MTKRMGLNPSEFEDERTSASILSLIANDIKPDKKTSAEIHSLDIHCVMGIGSVADALTTWADEHEIGYQELSRYACLVAGTRMAESTEVIAVTEAWSNYRRVIKKQKEAIRRACGNPLKKLANGYEPLSLGSYHVWVWGDDNKQSIFGTLKKMSIGVRIFNPFLAGALSELPDLDELAYDLRGEHEQGLRHLRIVSATINSYSDEFRHENRIY